LWVFPALCAVKTTINGHPYAVCRVKIALQAIFGGFMREAQQTAAAYRA
jgi:hypothetical protein